MNKSREREGKLVKAKGVVRKIDNLGRITIPIEMRRSIGLEVGEEADIHFANGVLCITKYVDKVDKPDIAAFTEEELMAELYKRQSQNGGNK